MTRRFLAIVTALIPALSAPVFADEQTVSNGQTVALVPSGATLPANTLRLYVEFDRAMAQGDVYRHLSLREIGGATVPAPFLHLPRGLWNAEQTRLTVLFDPGRLKRGVGPNLRDGAPLEAGKSYILSVSGQMLDARGVPLEQTYQFPFAVGEVVLSPLHTSDWRVRSPEAGTLTPLFVETPVLIDPVGLAQQAKIGTLGDGPLYGSYELSVDPMGWRFIPEKPWGEGAYKIELGRLLEDVSGNSFDTAFDRAAFQQQVQKTAPAPIYFEVVVR